MNKLSLYSWVIFNLFIGIWEIYIFIERDKLVLEKQSFWNKINNGNISINTLFIDAWSEYTKVDSRYIKKYSPYQYVWIFELLNAFLAIIFIIVLFMKNIKWIKYILLLELINCILYFLTLGIEISNSDSDNDYNNNINSNTILNNIKNYASFWMIPVYYLISSIWIIVPILLLS